MGDPGETSNAVFQLVERGVNQDTVQFFRQALAAAERGEVMGFAGVIVYSQREFSLEIAGECGRSPHWSRGILLALDDKLARLGGSR